MLPLRTSLNKFPYQFINMAFTKTELEAIFAKHEFPEGMKEALRAHGTKDDEDDEGFLSVRIDLLLFHPFLRAIGFC
ncbi:MAG: hypothetical protein ACI8RD_012425 [Bacillariaceae sp.]